jgi:hypothetical protein
MFNKGKIIFLAMFLFATTALICEAMALQDHDDHDKP